MNANPSTLTPIAIYELGYKTSKIEDASSWLILGHDWGIFGVPLRGVLPSAPEVQDSGKRSTTSDDDESAESSTSTGIGHVAVSGICVVDTNVLLNLWDLRNIRLLGDSRSNRLVGLLRDFRLNLLGELFAHVVNLGHAQDLAVFIESGDDDVLEKLVVVNHGPCFEATLVNLGDFVPRHNINLAVVVGCELGCVSLGVMGVTGSNLQPPTF